ncbi:MAG TPA: energy transducer TonB [Terracidiphilus sp.]|nr:energy transducer TonB [Terracidiphilus sp.]
MTRRDSPRSNQLPHDNLPAFLSQLNDGESLWAEISGNLHDLFFSRALPPLELTSTPVTVPDRMAGRTNPWAIGTATLVNGGIMALMILLGMRTLVHPAVQPVSSSHVDLSHFDLFAPASTRPGSEGGGTHDLVDPIQGRLPKFVRQPLAPPQIPILLQPKLAVDSAIANPQNIVLPDNPPMPNIGVHSSVNVTLLSNGQGGPAGIGTGKGHSLGPGTGSGPGLDAGDGIYTPGRDGVSAPVPIFTPEAEFSDEARRSKYQGVCLISIIVDAHGNPWNPRIIRRLGMGLDEKALEAVSKYRFKPAIKQGRPVAAQITVAVDFRLF